MPAASLTLLFVLVACLHGNAAIKGQHRLQRHGTTADLAILDVFSATVAGLRQRLGLNEHRDQLATVRTAEENLFDPVHAHRRVRPPMLGVPGGPFNRSALCGECQPIVAAVLGRVAERSQALPERLKEALQQPEVVVLLADVPKHEMQ